MTTCILHFLNNNAGAISAIATVVLTILTAFYVYLTRTLAKEAKRQADLVLNERNSQFHRELIEKVYLPLSRAINPLTACLTAETPPVFNEWTRIKEEAPFLAYRIEKDLLERLNALADTHSGYYSQYNQLSKELHSIIRKHFPALTFLFIYNKDITKPFYISYLQLLFFDLKESIKMMADIVTHSHELDEKLIGYVTSAKNYNPKYYANDDDQVDVISLDKFEQLWNDVKSEIEQHSILLDWLTLKRKMTSQSEDILADLEKLIRSNSDH